MGHSASSSLAVHYGGIRDYGRSPQPPPLSPPPIPVADTAAAAGTRQPGPAPQQQRVPQCASHGATGHLGSAADICVPLLVECGTMRHPVSIACEPLHRAIRSGNLKTFDAAIKKLRKRVGGTVPGQAASPGRSALGTARGCRTDATDMASVGATGNDMQAEAMQPAADAATDGARPLPLLNHVLTTGSWTPLHTAVTHCDVLLVRQLLQLGCDPNVRDSSGQTCMHKAAVVNCDAVRQQVEENAALDWDKHTPLMERLAKENLDLFRVLVLEGRGDVNLLDGSGYSVLHLYLRHRKATAATVQFLIQYATAGAVVLDTVADTRSTPLHAAAAAGLPSVVSFMVDQLLYFHPETHWERGTAEGEAMAAAKVNATSGSSDASPLRPTAPADSAPHRSPPFAAASPVSGMAVPPLSVTSESSSTDDGSAAALESASPRAAPTVSVVERDETANRSSFRSQAPHQEREGHSRTPRTLPEPPPLLQDRPVASLPIAVAPRTPRCLDDGNESSRVATSTSAAPRRLFCPAPFRPPAGHSGGSGGESAASGAKLLAVFLGLVPLRMLREDRRTMPRFMPRLIHPPGTAVPPERAAGWEWRCAEAARGARRVSSDAMMVQMREARRRKSFWRRASVPPSVDSEVLLETIDKVLHTFLPGANLGGATALDRLDAMADSGDLVCDAAADSISPGAAVDVLHLLRRGHRELHLEEVAGKLSASSEADERHFQEHVIGPLQQRRGQLLHEFFCRAVPLLHSQQGTWPGWRCPPIQAYEGAMSALATSDALKRAAEVAAQAVRATGSGDDSDRLGAQIIRAPKALQARFAGPRPGVSAPPLVLCDLLALRPGMAGSYGLPSFIDHPLDALDGDGCTPLGRFPPAKSLADRKAVERVLSVRAMSMAWDELA